jgi:hypothetical protein
MKQRSILQPLAASLVFAGIAGCSDNDSNDGNPMASISEYQAVISTVSSVYDATDIQLVDLEENTLIASDGIAPSADSDITVSAHGTHFYRIGRYDIDTITKYSVTVPDTPIWQYSTKDDDAEPTANPYHLVFASETKAYLLRYGSSVMWVVNPSAATEDQFKIGEIDLSAYDEGDGTPEMSDGIIVDGKLFVTLERQFWFDPSQYVSYVAVIDTNTDTEIETNADGSDSLMGIPLHTHNAGSLAYSDGVGIVVQSIGDYGSSWSTPPRATAYLGGIEVIDPDTYTTSLLVDDGDDSDHPYGLITDVAIVSDAVGYFTGYTGWQSISVYRFSPSTGAVEAQPLADFDGIDVRGLAVDPDQFLWVSVADGGSPRVDVVDPASNAVVGSVGTVLNPNTVVFTQAINP